MNRFILGIVLSVAVFVVAPLANAQQRPLSELAPSVVRIRVEGTAVGAKAIDNQGTGFFVSSDGLIVTAFHVIGRDATTGDLISWDRTATTALVKYFVEFPGSAGTLGAPVQARLVTSDPDLDLAILRIQGSRFPGLPCNFARLPEESEVRAIGWRKDNAVYDQITGKLAPVDVVALGERYRMLARSARGNSGGPMFDAEGKVVGLITSGDYAGSTPDNEVYGVPAEWLERFLPLNSTCRQSAFLRPPSEAILRKAGLQECIDSQLEKLVAPVPFSISRRARTEGGGAMGKSDYDSKSLVFTAPEGYELLNVKTATLERNRGVGEIGFSGLSYVKDDAGRLVDARVSVWAKSPPTIFGPGNWHMGELSGEYRRVIDDTLRQSVLDTCQK